MRDVRAIVTERGAGCDGRCGVRCFRTGRNVRGGRRSRVVLTPRPWRQVGAKYRADDGGKTGRSPGRARISRKTIARGKPGCLGCTCQIRVHSSLRSAHGDAGAVGARLSLRPLSKREQRDATARTKTTRGNENACLSTVIARSVSDDPSTLATQATPGWESAEARRAKAEAIQLCCGDKESWIASLRSQ